MEVISSQDAQILKQKEDRYHALYRPKFDETMLGYDIYNCPPQPPENYPMAWKTNEVLLNWNPNDVTTIAPNYREVYQVSVSTDRHFDFILSITA